MQDEVQDSQNEAQHAQDEAQDGQDYTQDRQHETQDPISGSCRMIVTWSALHTAFVFLWVVFLTTKWHGRSGKSTSVSARAWNWEWSASLRKAADLASSPLCPHELAEGPDKKIGFYP